MYTYRGAYLNALDEALVTGLSPRVRLPLAAADVPLQRLVLHLGRHRGRRPHVCLRKVEPDLRLGPDRRRGRHQLQRRARPCSIDGRQPPEAHRVERQVTVMVAAAPPSPTLFAPHGGAELPRVHVYGLTETYGPHTMCAWQPEWRRAAADERARLLSRQGQGVHLADPCASSTSGCTTSPATARRWARS